MLFGLKRPGKKFLICPDRMCHWNRWYQSCFCIVAQFHMNQDCRCHQQLKQTYKRGMTQPSLESCLPSPCAPQRTILRPGSRVNQSRRRWEKILGQEQREETIAGRRHRYSWVVEGRERSRVFCFILFYVLVRRWLEACKEQPQLFLIQDLLMGGLLRFAPGRGHRGPFYGHSRAIFLLPWLQQWQLDCIGKPMLTQKGCWMCQEWEELQQLETTDPHWGTSGCWCKPREVSPSPTMNIGQRGANASSHSDRRAGRIRGHRNCWNSRIALSSHRTGTHILLLYPVSPPQWSLVRPLEPLEFMEPTLEEALLASFLLDGGDRIHTQAFIFNSCGSIYTPLFHP